MMIFPGMLIEAAKRAGIKVPEVDVDKEDYDKYQFPHFGVFCNMQLNRPVVWGEHWDNAKIIATIPEDKIKDVTLSNLFELGCQM